MTDQTPEQVLAEATVELDRLERRRAPRQYTPKTACPHCKHQRSDVIDPRPTFGGIDGDTYWRVRECKRCHCQYSTEEVPREIVKAHEKSA